MFLLLQLVICVVIHCSNCDEVNIAGIFEGNEILERALKFGIESCNELQTGEEDYIFKTVLKNELEMDDPFSAQQHCCEVLSTGIVALFGPREFSNSEAVQAICDAKEIPHFISWWKPPARGGTQINFYPHPPLLSNAYLDIVEAWGWTTMTVLYEDNESLNRMASIIARAKSDGIVVDVKQLDPFQTGYYRDTIKQLKISDQRYFVIDCRIENLDEVLKQIQQAGLMNEKYNYFLTNLDAHTIDLTPYQYSSTNITGIRVINPESEYVQSVAEKFFSDDEGAALEAGAWALRTEPALIIDAVHMFSRVLNDIRRRSPVTLVNETNSLECAETSYWKHGYSLVNSIKTSSHEGLTGHIKFNREGFRSDFSLEIFELREGGITDIGRWNASSGLELARIHRAELADDMYSMRNKTFVVQITLTEPYGMLKETPSQLLGNERFEGFAIDLIEKLAEIEGFNFTFVVREDKKNGELDKKLNKWTGMIGDLLDNVTDMAITDFTITAEREAAVDFTDPFMSLGISILFKKPKNAPPSFFSFADPFALDTWVALAGSFFIVAFSLYILGRMCADEWTNPYPCVEEPEYLYNQFSLANSIWFATGSLMCQGSEIAPIAMSTRMVAGMWWFFCLIMVASYTANLAAFLATENPVELFKDLESLYDNKHGVKYGAKEGGATLNFFLSSEEGSLFRKVGEYMKAHPENVKENDEGVRRAESEVEDFAFFMESTSIEYNIQRHCTLKKYGKNLDEKGYGIALRKDSPYRKRLSSALLRLQSAQYIDEIKRKWWEERKGGGQCTGQTESAEADPLKLVNVGGCFWVTIYGTVIAAVLVVVEHLMFVLKVSQKTKTSFREAFNHELKAYLDFNSDVKPVLSKEDLDESKSESGEMEEEKHKTRSKTRSRSRSRSHKKTSKSTSKSKSKKESGEFKSNGGLKVAHPYGFIFSNSTDRLNDSP